MVFPLSVKLKFGNGWSDSRIFFNFELRQTYFKNDKFDYGELINILKHFYKILLITCLYTAATRAQNTTFTGIVKDTNTKEALAYAHIFLKNYPLGTVANSEGRFKIIIPKKYQHDSLIVSFIGYESKAFSIAILNHTIHVSLQANTKELSAITITDLSAANIIDKAIDNIPNNYFRKPYISKGFYRISSREGQKYIHLSEAVFELYQSKISTPSKQFRLNKVRGIKDEKSSQGLELGIEPEGIFATDIANHINSIDLINKKGRKIHEFMLNGTQVIDGREAYEIAFNQKENIRKAGYKGKILIDKISFAFLYLDFGLSEKGVAHKKYGNIAERTLLKLFGVHVSVLEDNWQIRYKKIGNKYYLNDVVKDLKFRFRNGKKYDFIANIRLNYLVTSIKLQNCRAFPRKQTLAKHKFIKDRQGIYNPEFWEDYTILLPTQDFSTIAKRIESRNKAYNSSSLK